MVKALIYGADNLAAIGALEDAGADMFGVSSVDEAVMLRRSGSTSEILIFLTSLGEIGKAIHLPGITFVAYSIEFLSQVIAHADTAQTAVRVHIECDTGMNRTGIAVDELSTAIAMIEKSANVRLTGFMTHFATADEDGSEIARAQLNTFMEAKHSLVNRDYGDIVFHAANTAAAVSMPSARFDMVRIGIGLHGVNPTPWVPLDLRPSVSLVSQIVEIAEVKQGETIGYGGTYTAMADMRIAVVAAGYYDGIPRSLSNMRQTVVIHGTMCDIVGRVSMDSMMIDVSNVPTACEGSDVLIYGDWNGNKLDISQVAESIDTIPYELMTRVGGRVQRIAVSNRTPQRPIRSRSDT